MWLNQELTYKYLGRFPTFLKERDNLVAPLPKCKVIWNKLLVKLSSRVFQGRMAIPLVQGYLLMKHNYSNNVITLRYDTVHNAWEKLPVLGCVTIRKF